MAVFLGVRWWQTSPAVDERACRRVLARVEAAPAGGFPAWLHSQVLTQAWAAPISPPLKLDRQTVESSLRVGRQFLLHNQKPAGNFNYSYDFVERRLGKSDQQVRQAGALWLLALLVRDAPSDRDLRAALDRSLDFFLSHSRRTGTNGALAVAYPGAADCQAGTVALTALAIIEHLRSPSGGMDPLSAGRRRDLATALDGYLRFLESIRLENQHFASAWSWSRRARTPVWDPYSDGESLLCLIEAAKYLDGTRFVPQIEESMAHLVRHYTAGEWLRDPDSGRTKEFFQWGCLALWEYQDTGWKEASLATDYLLWMGWWLVHAHGVLNRSDNAAANFEGLIPCWRAARKANRSAAADELRWTIDQGLARFVSWQVGGPLQEVNPFLKKHPTTDPLAVGGVMETAENPVLRIDFTLHQLHALLLVRDYLLP